MHDSVEEDYMDYNLHGHGSKVILLLSFEEKAGSRHSRVDTRSLTITRSHYAQRHLHTILLH